jgi:hypothetical protein
MYNPVPHSIMLFAICPPGVAQTRCVFSSLLKGVDFLLINFSSPCVLTWQALMLTQYSSKLLIALLTLQHALRIRLRHGTKGYHAIHGGSSLAKKVERLSSIISDARVLYRIWGILPIIKTVSTSMPQSEERCETDYEIARR